MKNFILCLALISFSAIAAEPASPAGAWISLNNSTVGRTVITSDGSYWSYSIEQTPTRPIVSVSVGTAMWSDAMVSSTQRTTIIGVDATVIRGISTSFFEYNPGVAFEGTTSFQFFKTKSGNRSSLPARQETAKYDARYGKPLPIQNRTYSGMALSEHGEGPAYVNFDENTFSANVYAGSSTPCALSGTFKQSERGFVVANILLKTGCGADDVQTTAMITFDSKRFMIVLKSPNSFPSLVIVQ